MPTTKHVTKQIEAYLDDRLSTEERRWVEAHLAICPTCSQRLFDAERLRVELGPVMKKVLGQPSPPPGLQKRVRYRLAGVRRSRRFSLNWHTPARMLNAVGTLAIVILLMVGVFTAIQGRLPGTATLLETDLLPPNNARVEDTAAATSTPIPTVHSGTGPSPASGFSSLSDTLALSPSPTNTVNDQIVEIPPRPSTNTQIPVLDRELEEANPFPAEATGGRPARDVTPPGGTIAFAFFNSASHRQIYETHLVNPDGSNHRLFELDGISEPALRNTKDGYQIVYRAWGETTTPRSLASNNLMGKQPLPLTHFWEDAQPDWSPTENRIIFASQRESDRHWRLYTVWGDGSVEVNLRREGKSPTFAPDGYRFAFESCDSKDNRCGLWLADLANSEYDARSFLEDPLAKSPDWSPVGEQIAYMANLEGNWDLYLVNSDGNNVRRLTTDPAIDGLPAWSPDGEWLTFLSDRNGNWGIWLLHIKSSQMRKIFSFDGGSFVPPNRPPYGERNWWDEQLSWSE